MSAREVTVRDLVRALTGGRVQVAIDDALRAEAGRIASALATPEIETTVERRAPGEYIVRASGPNLFAREFGSIDRAPERPLSRAIGRQAVGGGE